MKTLDTTVSELVDQRARDRFCNEINSNFSVIAPAGVGKTAAIVQRLTSIAKASPDGHLLKEMIVVTYTEKAASEMFERTRQELMRQNVPKNCLDNFNRAFFGTIHSLCMNLIQNYGYFIGLPSNLEVIDDEEMLWTEFCQANESIQSFLQKDEFKKLNTYLPLRELFKLARKINLQKPSQSEALKEFPRLKFEQIFNFSPSKARASKIEEAKQSLTNWLKEIDNFAQAFEIPQCTVGGAEFKAQWADTFLPLWDWLAKASFKYAYILAEKYRAFRISKGYINYNDMMYLANAVLQNDAALSAISSKKYRIILDEAQDTDAAQFKLLLKLATLNEVTVPFGNFSMVGDPQQAIYSSRADLSTYLGTHNELIEQGVLEKITFQVTFRCDEAVVSFVNHTFPSVLTQKNPSLQVDYVPLEPRPWANKGSVCKLDLNFAMPEGKPKLKDLLQIEAQALASYLNQVNNSGTVFHDWSEVALICPRRDWLLTLSEALKLEGIPYQIHSRNDQMGDNPAFAWLCALMAIASDPYDGFEIAGVLREIFGLSDDSIAWHVKWWEKNTSEKNECPHPLNIARPSNETGDVPSTLNILCSLRQKSLSLSLSDCVKLWVNELNLKERLGQLTDYSAKVLNKTLDQLLVNASQAEEDGLTLVEWAEALKKQYKQSVSEDPPLAGHIQLYTSHKSKGLEWPVVIIPFLFRSIQFPSSEYPQLFDFADKEPSQVCVFNHPAKAALDARLYERRRAELERLLYVTVTRARSKLILVDDEVLFDAQKNAYADILQIAQNQKNRGVWERLPTQQSLPKVEPNPVKLLSQKNNSTPSPSTLANEDPSEIDLSLALKKNKDYIKKYTPSHLVSHDFSKDYLAKVSSHPKENSLAYGNWWHSLMEHMPWNEASNATLLNYCDAQISLAPTIERAREEVHTLLNSPLAEILKDKAVEIKTEVPFSVKTSSQACYDGVIDLIAFNTLTKQWTIIDWKTDLIDPENTEYLAQTYKPQMEAYKKALFKAYPEAQCSTYLYHTPQGLLLQVG